MIEKETNSTSLGFSVIGGSDNSGNWWHEYSIQGGEWLRVDENSKLTFGAGLSSEIQVCVRAVDASNNNSEQQSCKFILVDTRNPEIIGVKDGEILSKEIYVSASDDRLASVEVWYNGSILELDSESMPFKFERLGSYQVIAKDDLGNETVASFMIDADTHMNIVNDISSDDYTVTAVEFDRRFLIRVDVNYDQNGYSNIYVKLDNVSIKSNDMLYILGVLPDTNNTFVMSSINGVNIGNYANGINLIGNGNNFKDGVNNEDCFVKFNDYYYAYVLIKENAYNDTVAVVDDNEKKSGDSKVLSVLLVSLGAIIVVVIGYQIVKFRKRVRAA
jgi:hypothetical protein